MVEMLNSLNFDFVVFDFDGVLVDSTALKTKIFESVVSTYPEVQKRAFIDFHKLHGGVSRWEKFDYFLRQILKVIDEAEIKRSTNKLSNDFTAMFAERLKELKLTEGASSLLEKLKDMNKRCFIVSGGAEIEVQEICKRFKIDKSFDSILGSPRNKEENLKFLKDQCKLQGTGLFIGDSYTDYKSAIDFDMKFIFMNQYSEWKEWQNNAKDFYLSIYNLKELEQRMII